MSTDGDKIRRHGEKSRFLWKELRVLADILEDLHMRISTKLLEERMESPVSSKVKGGSVDISQTLKDYIDTNLGDEVRAEKVSDNPRESSPGDSAEEISAEAGTKNNPHWDAPLRRNKLSSYLKGQTAGLELAHHMGEKMRTTTFEHMNRTVQLAKQGDREGAYVHAELAENAMRLAREHMTKREYETLEDEVQERMSAAWSKSHAP